MVRIALCSAVLLCLGTVGLSAPAKAKDFVSGSLLARTCANSAVKEASLCDGYIAGALDEVAGNAALRDQICPPPDTKLAVLREALGRYGREHTVDAGGSGTDLLHAMLKANYPCAKR